jgi:hypothetical protein
MLSFWIRVILAALMAAVPAMAALPEDVFAPPTKKQMWIVRIEGEKGAYLIPRPIMRLWELKNGTVISLDTARLIARDMGARYTPEMLKTLERIDRESARR